LFAYLYTSPFEK